MREKEIEKKLTLAVKQAGGICPKLVSPGFDGMPDRMVLLPNGRIGFVEVKALGEKPATSAAFPPQAFAAAGISGVCAGRYGADWRDTG